MILHDVKLGECWTLQGRCGCELRLDRAGPSTSQFDIGTIGTRRSDQVRVKPPLYARFAETLAALDRTVLVVDTRRSGCGAQGSWGPLELATLVPNHWSNVRRQENHEYMYMHLPVLAPSVSLLDRGRAAEKQAELSTDENKLDVNILAEARETVRNGDEPLAGIWRHWEVFREGYFREISQSPAVLIGRALVEHATARGAVVVFLCAEPFVPDFDTCDRKVQNATYCH